MRKNSILFKAILLLSMVVGAFADSKTVLYESQNLTGISNAKMIHGKVVVGFGETGISKDGYPTNQKWYSLYFLDGDKKVAIDDSGLVVNANELSIAELNGKVAVAYQQPTGQSYGFDSPYRVYGNDALVADKMIFTNANWGCCTSLGFDSHGYAHTIQFGHAGYFLNYSTNKSGSWVNDNISGYSTYYNYPKLTIDHSDNIHVITSQLSANYGIKGLMQHWYKSGNSWSKETIATDSTGHGKLTVDSSNTLYGSYVDENDNLKVFHKNSSGDWVSEVVASSLNLQGRETRVAISKSGNIYVVAKNRDGDKLYLFEKNGSSWKEIYKDENLTKYTNDNSKAPSILFDESGNVILVYADDSKIYEAKLGNATVDLSKCTQVITHAFNPTTGEEKDFATPCDVPKDWIVGKAPDSDNDGVNDIKDAFPDDPAASIDNDYDGYPDSWNPGKSVADSTTGLKLDSDNVNKSSLSSNEISNLSTGWHLLGTSMSIDNLSILNSAKIVWAWDDTTQSWKAYSSDATTMNSINNKENIQPLNSIKANEGFWILK